MRRLRAWAPVPFLVFASGCTGQIPVVGLDDNGKVIEQMVRKRDYVTKLSSGVTDLQESVLPALDGEAARSVLSLRQTNLGLGLQGDVGIGDYFKLGGNIGIRLVFVNK